MGNFPENDSEMYQEGVLLKKASKYYGVCVRQDKWQAKRWSKDEKKMVTNGMYKRITNSTFQMTPNGKQIKEKDLKLRTWNILRTMCAPSQLKQRFNMAYKTILFRLK